MVDQGSSQEPFLRDRFSQQSLRVLFYARRELSLRPASRIEPEYVLLGIIRAEPSAISTYLASGWTVDRVEATLSLPPEQDVNALPEHVDVPFSPAVLALLRRAVLTADQLGSSYVDPRHLLVALLEDESQAVVRLLREAGVNRELILESLKGPTAP